MAEATLEALRGTAPATTERKAPTLRELIESPKMKLGLQKVAGNLMRADKVISLAVNALSNTPNLALCSQRSVLGAIMASTALGLEFNTRLGHAYLIPYKRRALVNGVWQDVYDCQFQIGYKGYLLLSHRSDFIDSLEANAVYQGDHFKHMMGSHRFVEYAVGVGERGPLLAAYCLTKHGDNELASVLPAADVWKIRERSETYRYLRDNVATEKAKNGSAKDLAKAEEKLANTPWVLWEDVMASKSAIKRHCSSRMPLEAGDAMGNAVLLDGAGDDNPIDLGAMADPEVAAAVAKGEAEPPVIEHQAPDELLTTKVDGQAEPMEREKAKPRATPRTFDGNIE